MKIDMPLKILIAVELFDFAGLAVMVLYVLPKVAI
jgi:hypothetical protein